MDTIDEAFEAFPRAASRPFICQLINTQILAIRPYKVSFDDQRKYVLLESRPKMFQSAFLLVGLLTAHACAVGRSSWTVPLIDFSPVRGYFLQDLNSTNASTFDYVRLLLLRREEEKVLTPSS